MRHRANTCQNLYPIWSERRSFFFWLKTKTFFYFKSYAFIGEKGLRKIATAQPFQNTIMVNCVFSRFKAIETMKEDSKRCWKKSVARLVFIIIIYCSAFISFWTTFFFYYLGTRFFPLASSKQYSKIRSFHMGYFKHGTIEKAKNSSQHFCYSIHRIWGSICLLAAAMFVSPKRRFNVNACMATSHRCD